MKPVPLDEIGEIADLRTLEQAVAAEDRKRRLSEALEQIKDEYRIAIHLVYLEEMSYDDAGKIMGRSRKQIENLVYRGKKALRDILGEKEEF